MENKVIPTVFALNKRDFNLKLQKLDFAKELHIDYMDGQFVENKSVEITKIDGIKNYPKIKFQIHLMSYRPSLLLEELMNYKNIDMVLFQIESFYSSKELEGTLDLYKRAGFKVGLVLKPKTQVKEINYYIPQLDCIMLMSVEPGNQGQEFIDDVLEKAYKIRQKHPFVNIQIDGGINNETILKVKKSQINVFCVGSYISSHRNTKEKYDELVNLVSNK